MNRTRHTQALVTGATSGLGYQIAMDLATGGARLVLGCRDLARGARAAAEIARRTGAPLPLVLQVDTSSAASIRAFGADCRARLDGLDVLVNNAGTVELERRESVDGVELTFGTNVLGYHAVTRELLPLLEASAPSRIVVVASTFAGDLDLDDLEFRRRPYDGLQAYAQSKACNRLLTWALARRLPPSVTANAMAPGFVPDTNLARQMTPDARQARRGRGGRTIAQGADTASWLATSGEVDDVTSGFFYERRQIPCEFRDHAAEERLFAVCEQRLAG